MFSLGFSELILILLVAFLIVGPKDLPKVARTIGRWVRTLRSKLTELKDETGLGEAVDELRSTQKELNAMLRENDPRPELSEAVKVARATASEAREETGSAQDEPTK